MIIKSKLSIPEALPKGIVRQRLLANIDQYKLTLICAPAGYGKTTAMADWAKQQTNIAWFKIDRFDDNVEQFYRYLVHAVSKLPSIACPASLKQSQNSNHDDLIDLLTLLINELSQSNQAATLVLDNYQHINNPLIHQGIGFFIKNMPEQWRVVIASRSIPPLAVSNLRIKRQLLEINETDLAFTQAETDAFFSRTSNFERDPVIQEALWRNVDGWPIALQFMAILSTDSTSFNATAQQIGTGNHPYLWDYLEEEVFSLLSQPLQTLLMTIAPLHKVDAEMVNQLCNISDGQERLEALLRQGAFLVSASNQQQYFSLHTFFKAFLVHKSEHNSNSQSTHKKIAQLWLTRQNLEQALIHALISQDQQLLIELLLKNGWQLFNSGQLKRLNECFTFIQDKIWLHPPLLLLKAWMLQSCYQSDQVLPLLEKATRLFTQQGITLTAQQQNEFVVIEAQIAIAQGKAEQALKQAESVVAFSADNPPRINIIAQMIIGEAYQYLGELPLAYHYFQQAKQSADQHNLQQHVIWSLYQQAEILQAQNNHSNAERHIDAAISLINKYQLQKLPLYTFLLHFKARQAYQKGDFTPAEYLCEHALRIALPYGPQWCLATYTLQADIAGVKGEQHKVAQLLTEIERALHHQCFYYHGIADCDYVRIHYWRESNDRSAMLTWLDDNPPVALAVNRFAQSHNRNRALALIHCGELQLAKKWLEKNLQDAQQADLQIETNQNLILLSCVTSRLNQPEDAQNYLHQAIELALTTELTMSFVRERKDLQVALLDLAKSPGLPSELKEKLFDLLALSGIRLHQTPKVPFDLAAVSTIQAHPQAPRLIRNIRLTPREWQVLGFIYSRYRNQQMAKAMGVAPTTVKSHIRNLYQKLGLENREEAMELAKLLVSLTR